MHYTIFRLLHILLNREELMNITGGSNCINSQFTFTLYVIQFNIRTHTITITHLLPSLCITTTPHIFHSYISHKNVKNHFQSRNIFCSFNNSLHYIINSDDQQGFNDNLSVYSRPWSLHRVRPGHPDQPLCQQPGGGGHQ